MILKQYERAIESYDMAIKLKNDYPSPYWNKGALFKIQGGKEQEAQACFSRAIELKPEMKDWPRGDNLTRFVK